MDINGLNPKLIDNINGYDIYFSLHERKHGLKSGIDNGIFFVKKGDDIVFVADSSLCQLKMKRQCEEYIENELKEKKQCGV